MIEKLSVEGCLAIIREDKGPEPTFRVELQQVGTNEPIIVFPELVIAAGQGFRIAGINVVVSIDGTLFNAKGVG